MKPTAFHINFNFLTYTFLHLISVKLFISFTQSSTVTVGFIIEHYILHEGRNNVLNHQITKDKDLTSMSLDMGLHFIIENA